MANFEVCKNWASSIKCWSQPKARRGKAVSSYPLVTIWSWQALFLCGDAQLLLKSLRWGIFDMWKIWASSIESSFGWPTCDDVGHSRCRCREGRKQEGNRDKPLVRHPLQVTIIWSWQALLFVCWERIFTYDVTVSSWSRDAQIYESLRWRILTDMCWWMIECSWQSQRRR